jgi:predicted AAA+ superfamily ATPase
MMIKREIKAEVTQLMRDFPAVGILGPRQIGKTTLALEIAKTTRHQAIYLDLESASDLAKLTEPELYFQAHQDRLIILDEIQRLPGIFTTLRGVIDKRKREGSKGCQFLVLGSASLELLRQSSESLAGRISYLPLSGLKPSEIPLKNQDALWLRGGFPDSYLADDDAQSFKWRQSFISTYLERDVPQLGSRIPAATLRNLWTMLAHVQGGLLNQSKLASGLGISVPTIHRYLDLLGDLFLIRKLQPWSANVGKRLVKSPKVYIRDSGVMHALLKIQDMDDLLGHPAVGNSWEGFVVETLLNNVPSWASSYFYRTSAGAEIDLVIEVGHKKRIAIEIKRSLSPSVSKGFQYGCKDVNPKHKYFVYPGKERFSLTRDVQAVPLIEMMAELKKIVAK